MGTESSQPGSEESRRRRIGLLGCLAVVGAGFGLRLWIAFWPLERLLATFVADDAFYYVQIARNIAAGHGSTFDGVIATNGYHPLWMLACVFFHVLFGPETTSVLRAMLVASAVLSAAGGLCIVWFAWRIICPRSAAGPFLATIFWAFNPFFLGTEMMGVEAPLALLMVLLAAAAFERWRTEGAGRWLFWAGLWGGLAFLARTDAGFFGAVLLVAALLHGRKGERPGAGELCRRAATLGLPAALVASPWLVWNLARYGTIWQDSGRTLFFRAHSMAGFTGRLLPEQLAGEATKGVMDFGLRLLGSSSPALAVLFVGLGFGLAAAAIALSRKPPGRMPWPLVAFAGCLWFFYVLVFWEQKFWYFLPLMASAAFFLARLGAFLEEVFSGRQALRKAVLVWVVVFVAGSLLQNLPRVLERGFHPWQAVYLAVARDLGGDVLPGVEEGDVVGAFNSGILGAFSGRRVVNLDGVVNPNIIGAMRHKRFLSYLRESGVSVLVDHLDLVKTYAIWSEPEFARSFRMIKRYKTPSFAGDVVVLRVLGEGETP